MRSTNNKGRIIQNRTGGFYITSQMSFFFPPHTSTVTTAGTPLMSLETMQWLKAVLSLDGTLNRKQQERRTHFLLFTTVGLCATLTGMASSWDKHMRVPVELVGTCVVMLGLATGVCAMLCKAPLTSSVLVSLYLATAGLLLWDLEARTISFVQCPLLVLVIDILLVMQVPRIYSLGLVCFIVVSSVSAWGSS